MGSPFLFRQARTDIGVQGPDEKYRTAEKVGNNLPHTVGVAAPGSPSDAAQLVSCAASARHQQLVPLYSEREIQRCSDLSEGLITHALDVIRLKQRVT